MYEAIKYADLLRRNAALSGSGAAPFRIAVLANITIAPIKEVLEFSLRNRGINAIVMIGDYDNVAQNSIKFHDYDAVLVFYELAGIVDKLPFELHNVEAGGIERLIGKAKSELAVTFAALATARLVVFNLLSAMPFTMYSHRPTSLDRICEEVNDFVRAQAPKAFRLVNLDKIFAACSVRACIDLRFFLSSRSLYQFQFLRSYCEFVCAILSAIAGHYKKVLILDCDNTLWKGVIGEDGLAGIQMFQEIQSLIVQWVKSGLLVCLCSKNNPEDVDAALHDPRMVLRDEHLIIKAINWNDKADNIAQIAGALGLGLDSIVFIDDSDFELELVSQKLPMVICLKVPGDYAQYLWSINEIAGLFYKESETVDDLVKTAQYRTEFARREQRTQSASMDEYLSSLQLCIRLTVNSTELVPRLAQLTQKTNQFNLTTRRMAAAELAALTSSDEYLVVGIDVVDKFGAYGTTGLILVKQTAELAEIENFLLSCRVIGRGVEMKAFDHVVGLLRARGVRRIHGTYRPTAKNLQVKDLYSRLGFHLAEENAGALRFTTEIDCYADSRIGYIRIENA